jgi:hypothetical protein
MDVFKLTVRIVLSGAVGLLGFLGTMTARCDDIGGVPTWERCTTWLGTPTFVAWPSGALDVITPLIFGVIVGSVSWWMLAKTPLKARQSPR